MAPRGRPCPALRDQPPPHDGPIEPLTAQEFRSTTRTARKHLDLERPVDPALVEAARSDVLQPRSGSSGGAVEEVSWPSPSVIDRVDVDLLAVDLEV